MPGSTTRRDDPRRRWRELGVITGLLGILACASSPEHEPGPGPEPTTEANARPAAPTPTPLAEIDVDAVLAAAAEPEAEPGPEPEPSPEPSSEPAEPLPFDEAQLARIAAVQDIVAAAAAAHGVDPTLINALIWVESKFERKARGPAGAQGLMQLMPKTAKAMAKRLARKRSSYDPDFNIHAGTLLLSRMLERFEGDVGLALAGYNRGGGTVSGWVSRGEELPEGVKTYIGHVLEAQTWFERLEP